METIRAGKTQRQEVKADAQKDDKHTTQRVTKTHRQETDATRAEVDQRCNDDVHIAADFIPGQKPDIREIKIILNCDSCKAPLVANHL